MSLSNNFINKLGLSFHYAEDKTLETKPENGDDDHIESRRATTKSEMSITSL